MAKSRPYAIVLEMRNGKTAARSQGIALITVLLFASVLAMMVLGLFQTLRGELFLSQAHRDEASAMYVAEAGLIDAMAELSNNPGWIDGFDHKPFPGVNGTYTITFNTGTGPFNEDDSINNDDGTHNENYRSATAVPAGCCSLVVIGKVGRSVRKVEALVRVSGGTYRTPAPIVSSGRVVMRGDVSVNGITSQSDPTPVDGDIHSNLNTADDDLVFWDNQGGLATANITGEVSSSGSSSQAVNLNGYTPLGGISNNAAQQSVPNVNILGQISSHSSAPNPTIPGSGTATLSGGPDYYYSPPGGTLTFQGDLVLNGVNLYVDGDLVVNGSITGDGSVYVVGSPSFQGDARISTATPDKVALFSHGDVDLIGFDGTAYMNSITGDAQFTAAWTQFQSSLNDFQTALAGSPTLGQDSFIDRARAEIAITPGAGAYNTNGGMGNTTGEMVNRLLLQPQSSNRDFMIDKMNSIRDVFISHGNGSAAEINALNNLANDILVAGAFDAVIDHNRYDLLNLVRSYSNQIELDRLGASYFQGLVFTHGSLNAVNEVTVVGAVVAYDDGSQVPRTVGSDTLNPGDLFLNNDVRVTYVEDFFTDNGNGITGPGGGLLLWMGR